MVAFYCAYVDSMIHAEYIIYRRNAIPLLDDILRISLLVRSLTFRICDPLIRASASLALAKCTYIYSSLSRIMRKRSLDTSCKNGVTIAHSSEDFRMWPNGHTGFTGQINSITVSRSFSFTKTAAETSGSKGWRLFLAAIDFQPRSARRTSGKTRHMTVTSATVDIGSKVGGFRQYRRPLTCS